MTRAVGQSVPMIDARARVTGEVDFTINLELPGMCHAHLLRSPHPHARIVSIDTSRAEAHPGVFAVVSRRDFEAQPDLDPYFGVMIRDMAPVAIDKVRFVGDVVAGVAAVDQETAAAAADLIEVHYEELPAIFDAETALGPGAPLVHEGPRRVVPWRPDLKQRSAEGTNIVNHFTLRRGDVEQGFAESDLVIESEFTSPPVEHVPLETHNCVAQFKHGKLTIWSSTQSPFQVQEQTAGVFGLPLTDVRVIVTTLGGGYGNKVQAKLEPVCAMLARKARRPVKLVTRREESFLVTTQHRCKVRIKTGVMRDGTLVASQLTAFYDCGPYSDSSPNLITRPYVGGGPYRFRHVKADSYGVYTNSIPAGPFRGYGVTQITWPHEAQMDIIADRLGMDPVELRMKNYLAGGDTFATGEPFPEGHYRELTEEVARQIGWRDGPLVVRDGDRVRAKGLAAVVKGGTALPSTSAVRLNSDGSMNVLVSAVEMGQGAQTVLAQIAADAIGLPLDKVRCSEPDTATTPFESMTVASRTTFTVGGSVCDAVRDLREQLAEHGAKLLGVEPCQVVVGDGSVSVAGSSEPGLPYGQVVRRAGRGALIGRGFFGPTTHLDLETGQGIGSLQWHPGVTGVEVEVDLGTGKSRVVRMVVAVYVGRMMNPTFCELQVEGGAFMGLSQALFEQLVVDESGQIVGSNLGDYMIPSFEDVPEVTSVHVMEVDGAEHVHGIGETAVPPVRPAIANAVSRAIGVWLYDLPVTPERVLRALAERHEPGSDDVQADEPALST